MSGQLPHVPWRPWSREAFLEAQKEDRPILLSLTSTWCQWCHAMDEDSYMVPEIVERITQGFVPIRVDSDRRPDVNGRYNMGGLPSTVFMTPTGDTLTGATYIAPPELRNVLQQVRDAYHAQKKEVYQHIHEAHARAASDEAGPALGSRPTMGVLDYVADNVRQMFNPENGGFGMMPKFPPPEVLEFLLFKYALAPEAHLLDMVTTTLDRMAEGEIFDPAAGGFFRSANGVDWTLPHTEKMLEVNVAMVTACLRAFQMTGEERHSHLAQQVLSYLDTTLFHEESGAFQGSQAADESYYALAAGDRNPSQSPPVDKTVFTDSAARAVSAYLLAGHVLQRDDCRQKALRCLAFLQQNLVQPEGAVWHYYDLTEGTGRPPVLFRDQAFYVQALLDAYQATGRKAYLAEAIRVAGLVQETFSDTQSPGYYDLPDGHEELGYLRYRQKLLPENAIYAHALLTLHALTEDLTYLSQADAILEGFVPIYGGLGHFAAGYAQAVGRRLTETVQFHIVGSIGTEEMDAMIGTCHRQRYPHKVIRILDPEEDADVIQDYGYDAVPHPTVYVCVGAACAPPLRSPADLDETVESLLNASQ